MQKCTRKSRASQRFFVALSASRENGNMVLAQKEVSGWNSAANEFLKTSVSRATGRALDVDKTMTM